MLLIFFIFLLIPFREKIQLEKKINSEMEDDNSNLNTINTINTQSDN
mgnify:CR=1 FL=1